MSDWDLIWKEDYARPLNVREKRFHNRVLTILKQGVKYHVLDSDFSCWRDPRDLLIMPSKMWFNMKHNKNIVDPRRDLIAIPRAIYHRERYLLNDTPLWHVNSSHIFALCVSAEVKEILTTMMELPLVTFYSGTTDGSLAFMNEADAVQFMAMVAVSDNPGLKKLVDGA